MEAMLRGSRAALELHGRDAPGVHIVLGNEACDLDSMVSAIVLAYFLTKTSLEQKTAFVPILNIPRSEFPLRGECTFLLRESQLSEDLLIFRDEIDLQSLHKEGRLQLTLVDHNVLSRADADLESAVMEVIDHRPLERPFSPGCVVTCEPVGSCSTLVTERIVQRAPDILDKELAFLLRSTIVLDCIDMAPAAGKVTPKDSEYVAVLDSRFHDLPPSNTVFEALQEAKFDVSGLTTEQMLRKDLKAVFGGDVRLAISAVFLTLEEFLARPRVKEELEDFCRTRGYDVLVIMTVSFNEKKEPSRQLAVYSPCSHFKELVSCALEKSEAPSLQLLPMYSPSSEIAAYSQGNRLASRKKVLPIIEILLKALETKGATAMHGCHGWKETSNIAQMVPTSCADICQDEDLQLPPTPMNSLVDGCPLDGGLPKLTPEDILEKINQMPGKRLAGTPCSDSH
ncbi:exopolyphosphatase PRUNE1 isoform X1 [Leucoraja erinacea]|uniref:exopolyphosphatase PRUNE1 isoform X1 n=2 Tax=Leucoraja erinaceus TaxID=7782 RepID=UPI00245467AC|nr:exopolyphosphatase PRUNE1 isoform X1 [Leucoraja erinacea]